MMVCRAHSFVKDFVGPHLPSRDPKMQTPNLIFKAEVRKTFGKLNEQEIDDCDACPDRLMTQLIDRYALSRADAQSKVSKFFRRSPQGSSLNLVFQSEVF